MQIVIIGHLFPLNIEVKSLRRTMRTPIVPVALPTVDQPVASAVVVDPVALDVAPAEDEDMDIPEDYERLT